ncbi:MAG: hypothetical protein KatS3mg129_1090 [Leptospiraceae bacterium]|nr:MAG: hypothetical protein KatS3mg129_1090 [Leptospiraceae bacterium]
MFLKDIIILSYKNISRNKKRSLILILAFFFGSLLISFSRFSAFGSHQIMIEYAVIDSWGYLQIASFGYFPEKNNIERALIIDEQTYKKIKHPLIKEISGRIFAYSLAAYKNDSTFVQFFSIDPVKEKKIIQIHKKIKEGIYLDKAQIEEKEIETYQDGIKLKKKVKVYPAIIGRKLANKLNVKLNNIIVVTTNQFDGSTGAILIKIVGIFETLDPILNQTTIFSIIEAGEELTGLNTKEYQFTSIAIGVKNFLDAKEVYDDLIKVFPVPEYNGDPSKSEIFDPVIFSWKDMIPEIVNMMDLDQASAELTLGFLIMILTAGAINTLYITIHERKKELGIMLAIGTSYTTIQFILFFELLFLVLSGLLPGLLTGMGISYYLELNPVYLTGSFKEMTEAMGLVPVYTAIVDPKETVIAIISMILPIIVFSSFVLRSIKKIQPVEIIRTL